MKKTHLERLKAAHLKNQMKRSPTPERFGKGAGAVAQARHADLGEVVAELLRKGLAD